MANYNLKLKLDLTVNSLTIQSPQLHTAVVHFNTAPIFTNINDTFIQKKRTCILNMKTFFSKSNNIFTTTISRKTYFACFFRVSFDEVGIRIHQSTTQYVFIFFVRPPERYCFRSKIHNAISFNTYLLF